MQKDELVENEIKEVEVGDYFDGMKLNKKHLVLAVILFVAFVIEAWELMMVVFVTDGIQFEFNLSDFKVGNILGALALGGIIGAPFWAMFSERVGRRKALIYCYLLFGATQFISVFSINYEMLYFLRVLTGVFLVGANVLIFPYYSELLPVKYRGRLSVFLATGFPIGTMVAVGVTALTLRLSGDFTTWRVVFIISALSSLWIILLKKIPESPYWLTKKGRVEEAKEVIEYLSDGDTKVPENERPYVKVETKRGNYFSIFKKQYIKLTTFVSIHSFTGNMGYWGLMTWIPTLLMQKGLSMSQSLGFVALSAIFQIPGYLAASSVTVKIGRKKTMIIFLSGAIIAGFLFAFSNTMLELYIYNFALNFFILGLTGVWLIWGAEIYPSENRLAGYSFGILTSKIGSALAPSIIGFIIGTGASFTFTVSFIMILHIIMLIAALFLPETEGEILR